MREEMRIPAMFRNVAPLDQKDLANVEVLIETEVDLIKERALKKIEQGSEYSSEFEEVEESDYISTDGEGNNTSRSKMADYNNNAIQVVRGVTIK